MALGYLHRYQCLYYVGAVWRHIWRCNLIGSFMFFCPSQRLAKKLFCGRLSVLV